MRKVIAVAIILLISVSSAYAAKPDNWIPPGHRGDKNHSAQANVNIPIDNNVENSWTSNLTVTGGSGAGDQINIPVKWHSDEISPRDPATFEGPWKEGWNTKYRPWEMKESWTDAEVADFPSGKVRVVSGLYRLGKGTNNVVFKKPKQMDGIQPAGLLRLACEAPECTPEALHRAAVETAHKKGIAYMVPLTYGADPTKVGGDWSLRIGGGGGGITGDGGLSGGGGVGGGKYWVGPGWLPYVVFECWVYIKEGQ